MPWSGPYYYRSVRINGRPRREYVGPGQLGVLAALLDEEQREERRERRDLERAERADGAELDKMFDRFDGAADQLACAALLAAGFRQHKRGEWRKQRARKQTTD